MTIGERIRSVRKNKGMSMLKLGEKIGITAAAVSRYELGQRNIGFDTIRRIADALDVTDRYLLFGDIAEEIKSLEEKYNALYVECNNEGNVDKREELMAQMSVIQEAHSDMIALQNAGIDPFASPIQQCETLPDTFQSINILLRNTEYKLFMQEGALFLGHGSGILRLDTQQADNLLEDTTKYVASICAGLLWERRKRLSNNGEGETIK